MRPAAVFTALLSFLPGLSLAATVTLGVATEVNTFDPHMTTSVGSDLSLASHLYDSLVTRAPDLSLQPDVALSWQAVSEDSWRFELDPRAHFADGEPLDAQAVAWNLQRVQDPARHARIAPWFAGIRAVRVLGPHSLEIDTHGPFPTLPSQLTMLFLLPPQWAASHDPATASLPSGPYAVAEFQPGDQLHLVRNPQYWKAPPYFDEVRLKIMPDASARVSALLAGEVDWISGIPLSEVKRIQADGRARAGVIAPSTRSVFIKLNTQRPPLDDVRVRQALNYAIDKQGMVSALFDGRTEVSRCQFLTPAYFGYNPALQAYPYDPPRARQLLREAGVAPGTRLQLEVPSSVYLQGDEVTQVIAAQLAAVGLDVQLVQLDFATWITRYLRTHQLGDMSLLAYAWPTIDADGILSLLQGGSAYAYFADAPFDAALAAGRSTLDPARRLEAYRNATARACEQAPMIFLYDQPFTYAESPRLRWQARADDWVRAYDMSAAP
ncbi:MAG: Heme-binding protein A [Stenotrophomonas maltophilia]|nr:MAG: Heme-binding protein A [Stenotrophomonas maltophilia]